MNFDTFERTISPEQARRVDQLAGEEFAIPSLLLMENAAINATSLILDLIDCDCDLRPEQAKVAVVCGGGNNGGDGYAIARHLHNWGVDVQVHAVSDPDGLEGDAATNAEICRRIGLALHHPPKPDAWSECHVLVDAVLGTGFHGEVRDREAGVIRQINAWEGPLVVAIDTPSGLDCGSGEPAEPTVNAHVTVTFVERKTGFANPASRPHLGELKVADIGVPPQLVDRVIADAGNVPV